FFAGKTGDSAGFAPQIHCENPADMRYGAAMKYILTIACPDATGIVAEVASYLRDRKCFIDESFQYGDPATGRFFMRAVFTRAAESLPIEAITDGFKAIAGQFKMDWSVVPAARKPKVLIAVSKMGHCLN